MLHPRILLVEDDDDAADAIAACLRRGHLMNPVHRCDDGAAALAWLASATPPALVLLDLGLPGTLTGFDVLRALRQQQGASLPVLIVTASNDESDRQEAARLGADGYVLKTEVASALVNAARSLALGWLLVSPAAG